MFRFGLDFCKLIESEPESRLEFKKRSEPESESGLVSKRLGLDSTRTRDSQVSGIYTSTHFNWLTKIENENKKPEGLVILTPLVK